MIWPIVIAGAFGALVASSRGTKTRVVKRDLVGPRTGLRYRAEELPDAGMLVVYAPDAVCTFVRKSAGGFHLLRAEGHPRSIEIIRSDIAPEVPAKEAKA